MEDYMGFVLAQRVKDVHKAVMRYPEHRDSICQQVLEDGKDIHVSKEACRIAYTACFGYFTGAETDACARKLMEQGAASRETARESAKALQQSQ
ncbi:hypothetical protein CDD83_8061 [Cordyceps sp. RAO-2017]|nr:hypothetical protein CDD83_8061 [Cordyceps sp. RAO-2017]